MNIEPHFNIGGTMTDRDTNKLLFWGFLGMSISIVLGNMFNDAEIRGCALWFLVFVVIPATFNKIWG